MVDDPLATRLLAASALARAAGKLALAYQRDPSRLGLELKGHQDVVTAADKAAETLIRKHLAACFPEDGVVGEEGGGDAARRVWVIDPIDGTANFTRHLPEWTVVIAYLVDDEIEIGVTYDPVHDELFTARRGGGAFRDGQPIRVSGVAEPGRACLGTTYAFKTEPSAYAAMLQGALEAGADFRRLGSTARALCHVADGRLDGLVALGCNSWDCVAGLLLVREAGGLSGDFVREVGLLKRGPAAAVTPALAALAERLVNVRPRA